MTCIKSWCCFLDCSSFLLSASSRCFCSCISSIFHFCMRSFFSRKYATVSPPLLRRFALPSVSFSASSFLCLFCVPPRFSRALLLISSALALSTFFLSFCVVSSTTASFSAISSSAFSTSLKSVSIQLAFSSSRIFALNLSLKRVYRSLTDRFVTLNLGMFKAVQIDRYFIPKLAPCDASFLCLEWFKNENLLTKTIVMLFSPLHVGSKDKNKMSETLIFFLFVLHVVCLFFFLLQAEPFFIYHI